MASNTENLNLLMKNPSTDGADTFNVQTMLNDNWQKIDNNAGTVAQALANILKPTTPPIIGLPPSTTPDGMFQALGNTGELHVWRKTVKNAEDVPAGYTLGEVQNVTKYPITDVRSGGYTIVTKAYSNLSVDDAGNVSVDESSYVNFYDDSSTVRGKFIQVYSNSDILFIPNDANISTDYKTVGSAVIHNHYTDKYQTVTGYPLTPAGTTTTYPVSTNPNAYQEGSDAKPAGYVLGDVVNTPFHVVNISSHSVNLHYASTVQVDEEGRIIDINTSAAQVFTISFSNPLPDTLKGKFVQASNDDKSYAGAPISDGQIYYIPNDAIFSSGTVIDRYQPVTGYAAIPAGTTIEYLGKLGDKARVQVVSYVGTGTYGESNPNSLTFNFAPKIVKFLFQVEVGIGNHSKIENFQQDGEQYYMVSDRLTTEFAQGEGFGYNSYAVRGKKSADGKTFAWYTDIGSQAQGNQKGMKYYFVAIG